MCKIAKNIDFERFLNIENHTKEHSNKRTCLRLKKNNALLIVLLISMSCIPNYSYANTDITNYVQSSYGSGNASLNFNINNQNIKYNYKNEYGNGSSLYNYNENAYDEQNVNVKVHYTSAQTEKVENTIDNPTLPTIYKDIIMPTGGGYGGALSNSAIIDNVDSFIFIHNSNRDGAGIYNAATGSIVLKNSLFINNISTWEGSEPEGGGIYSQGTLDVYSTDFIGNTTKAMGAAISNTGTIKNIKDSNFIANVSSGHSGAIYNRNGGVINNIENSNFVLNSTSANDDAGAITNGAGGTIDSIKSSVFIANKAYDWGGAIRNNGGTINSITNTDFIQNKITNKGGAIFTFSSIGTISDSNFIANTSENYGGAISVSKNSSTGSIESISNSNFINNTAGMYGGAISNEGTIGSIINTRFEGNKTLSTSGNAYGGAIYNVANQTSPTSTIGNISGDFINNQASGNKSYGGAIYNHTSSSKYTASIGNISGNFINNIAAGTKGYGGAIYNTGIIGDITGDFIENKASDQANNGWGGAIFTKKQIGNINGDFIRNYSAQSGGAIYSEGNGTIGNITGDFIGNSTDVSGGAIFNYASNMNNIKGDFIENNSGRDGGAINNQQNILDISGDFINNYSGRNGGAIYNSGTIGNKDENNNVIGGLINSSFIGNYAHSKDGEAKGGAIYTTESLNLFIDNKAVEIRDNYTVSGDVKDDNAIYLASADATLTIDIKNNGSLLLKDNIKGVEGSTTVINSDNTAILYLQNDINTNVSINNNIILNSINNVARTHKMNTLNLSGNIDMLVDVDLKQEQMDRISAGSYTLTDGATINVVGMNMISDMKDGQDVAEILFADKDLKDAVNGNLELPVDGSQTTFYTPIFKYNAVYDNRENEGYFVFTRGDKLINEGGVAGGGMSSSGNISDKFNPAVLASSSSATVGAVGTLNTTFNYTFNHADAFMNSPSHHRLAYKTKNRYAISDTNNVGRYNPLFLEQDEYAGVWVKPYSTFETVSLKNGPKVDNIGYGTLIGFDSELESLKNGWDRVLTGYVGYNGASQSYNGVDSVQNGGLLGGTVTLYKGNFFNATTLNVGASVASNDTMYGNEDFTMLMSGLGNKAGYNFEFKDGKVILQPSMFIGYSFVNTFDYTNAAGVKIDNKPLHSLQLAPSVKLIGNSKEGWQPYASVSMVWNLMGETDATANGHKLPEMSIKPYVQYGVGIQRKIKDKFTAYGQAMVQNGGRNGVSLSAGFKWSLGNDKNKEKVLKNNKQIAKQTKTKKVLKELSPQQKAEIIKRNSSKSIKKANK